MRFHAKAQSSMRERLRSLASVHARRRRRSKRHICEPSSPMCPRRAPMRLRAQHSCICSDVIRRPLMLRPARATQGHRAKWSVRSACSADSHTRGRSASSVLSLLQKPGFWPPEPGRGGSCNRRNATVATGFGPSKLNTAETRFPRWRHRVAPAQPGCARC